MLVLCSIRGIKLWLRWTSLLLSQSLYSNLATWCLSVKFTRSYFWLNGNFRDISKVLCSCLKFCIFSCVLKHNPVLQVTSVSSRRLVLHTQDTMPRSTRVTCLWASKQERTQAVMTASCIVSMELLTLWQDMWPSFIEMHYRSYSLTKASVSLVPNACIGHQWRNQGREVNKSRADGHQEDWGRGFVEKDWYS